MWLTNPNLISTELNLQNNVCKTQLDYHATSCSGRPSLMFMAGATPLGAANTSNYVRTELLIMKILKHVK